MTDAIVNPPIPSERFVGLDLIRLVSFFAIATFHISLIHYGTPQIDIANQSFVIRAAEQISRVLAFSGFTILFLTSMLTAYSGLRIGVRIRLFTFLIAGWSVFSALMNDDHLLVWDIYPLILTGILVASIAEAWQPRMVTFVGVIGFALLWIPFWDFRTFVHLPTDAMLVLGFGSCQGAERVEWPVFPWIGLVWFGYWLGQKLRAQGASGRATQLKLTRKELTFWGFLLAASVPNLGSYYAINLGEFFACEAYRQPPFVWWSHFIWPLALIRLAVAPDVCARLNRSRFFRAVSRLAISRRFWLAYIANYLFAHVLSYIVTKSRVESGPWNAPTIAFIAAFFVPATEYLTRFLLAVRRWIAANPATVATKELMK